MNKVLTAPRKPTLIPPEKLEVYQKLQKLRRLSDAIVSIDTLDKQSPQSIQQRQNLVLQRKALMKTMPQIRLVASNVKEPQFKGLKPLGDPDFKKEPAAPKKEPAAPKKEPDDCA